MEGLNSRSVAMRVALVAVMMTTTFFGMATCQSQQTKQNPQFLQTWSYTSTSDELDLLDGETTVKGIYSTIEMIDPTKTYGPGLVASLIWVDPRSNMSVLGRLVLWTPECSLECPAQDYSLSGQVIQTKSTRLTNWVIDNIGQGVFKAASGTALASNLWIDYFAINVPESMTNGSKRSLDQTSDSLCSLAFVDSLLSDQSGPMSRIEEYDILPSSDRKYYAVMQGDCNLVVYTAPVETKQVAWSSGTFGMGTNCKTVMQLDGNLVIYEGINGTAVWASNTYTTGFVGNFRFTILNTGVPVIHDLQTGQLTWSG